MWATCAETIWFSTFGDSGGPISRETRRCPPGGFKIKADLVVDTRCILNIQRLANMEFSFPIAIRGFPCLNVRPAARWRAWSFETWTHDWESELTKCKLGCDGHEVLRAEALVLPRVLPTLPPQEVGRSQDLLPHVHGFTEEALLDPSFVRLPESEVKVNWAKPVVRIAQVCELAPLIQ